MLEKDGVFPCLAAVRAQRVSLVDELEVQVDSIVEALVSRDVFTRDDREEVLCRQGARARVRKVLDIVECKGEAAADALFSIKDHLQLSTNRNTNSSQSSDYEKIQQKHKDVLKRRSECMLFYNSRHGEKILFSEHYVNLLLADGHQGLESRRHEVLSFGQQRLSLLQKSEMNRKISPSELFSRANGKQPVKKVLVTGVAGIGKTVLVQKMLHDFGRNKGYFGFDFIIHMSFRDLNLINKPTNLCELILRKNRHLAAELDSILANDEKLLIILDGFDEFKHYKSCNVDVFVSEPNEDAELQEVLGSFLSGELLPNASIMLTSRPTAINHIPVGCIDRFALISGFSLFEVKDFFVRYFQDPGLAEQMFLTVSANDLMLTLCYIPAFCHIVCCILRENKDPCEERPKTMTDIYVQYLVALLHSHTQARLKVSLQEQTAEPIQLSNIVLKLGRLAFKKLLEHQTLFYGSDEDVLALQGSSFISAFLDKTVAQEPGCTEEVFSFTHLTVQEFFAALYCAVTDQALPSSLESKTRIGMNHGHLDLFNRFLSGILSDRNVSFLSRQTGLCCPEEKVEHNRQKIVADLTMLCENGGYILNCLHCVFEQQDSSLVQRVQPRTLRINVGDETLSQMDYNAINYFLNFTKSKISELDLTGTAIDSNALRDMKTHLLRCEELWYPVFGVLNFNFTNLLLRLGENNLDMDAVQVIADVLRLSENIINLGLGWSNIGDNELIALSDAIRVKKSLKEIWIEGNQVTSRGLVSLCDLTPHPLRRVVAIWNLNETESDSTFTQKSIIVDFTDDSMWKSWGEWVFRRCEVSCNDKLVMILRKICNMSKHCLELEWAKIFYRKLSQLVKSRIECCTEEDVCEKLKKFDSILDL